MPWTPPPPTGMAREITIWVAVVPLLKLLTLTLIGLALRLRVAPRSTFCLLSKLVFALFLPCLIFVHLGKSIDLHNHTILRWWFVPVNVLLSTLLGCALGYAVVLLCRPPPEFARLVVIMTGFGNTGNLPIAVVGSVCRTVDESYYPFGPECGQNGIAYVSLAQWVAVVLVYTLVYHIMEPPVSYYVEEEEEEEEEIEVNGGSISAPLLHEAEWPGMHERGTEHSRKPFIARVFMSVASSSTSSTTHFPDITLDDDDDGRGGRSSPKSLQCLAEPRVVRRIRIVAEQTPIRHVLQPPTIASFLAILVGVIPTLREAVFGENAPLGFVSDSFDILGQGVVPFVMLMLGGMLAEGPSESALGWKTVAGVIVARLLILPVVGIGVVAAAGRMGLLAEKDEMFRFVLLLQYMTPSAILIGAIAGLRGYAVREASAVLFWQHIWAVFSLSFYIIIYFKLLI